MNCYQKTIDLGRLRRGGESHQPDSAVAFLPGPVAAVRRGDACTPSTRVIRSKVERWTFASQRLEDLVVARDDIVVFISVKGRSPRSFGQAWFSGSKSSPESFSLGVPLNDPTDSPSVPPLSKRDREEYEKLYGQLGWWKGPFASPECKTPHVISGSRRAPREQNGLPSGFAAKLTLMRSKPWAT